MSTSPWRDSVHPESDFSLQNLPLGVAIFPDGLRGVAIRIGDWVLNCKAVPELAQFGLLQDLTGLSRAEADRLRLCARGLLEADDASTCGALVPIHSVQMCLPYSIPAFVDFYSGIHHASNVGKMFRPDMPPLLPNYRHLPVGYNGRASSIGISGAPIARPSGQYKTADSDVPFYGPTQELDFELELGFFLSSESGSGQTIDVADAEQYMLGLVLVNDWSARDVQRWEYQPLGPFLAKSFATSISPWVVSLEALEPFRITGEDQEPQPLPHLRSMGPAHFDIQLEVYLQTSRMQHVQQIAISNARHLYWSFAQQLAHQASNGTPLNQGDLYASGTISGPEPGMYGSLLEATWRGTQPITLHETGEARTFLEPGDRVIFKGFCQGDGYRVGFGELENTVMD